MKRWFIILLLAVIVCALMLHFGVWRFNYPSQPVRGVDVSHYQGKVDWPMLASQNIRFAFVKATEGSASRDETFDANWRGAIDAGLRVGAYHFFSYDSPGVTQAENFIDAVPALPDMLPPVIDVEFYGQYDRSPAGPTDAVKQIRAMADRLREHYGIPPLIYATQKSYRLYIDGNFDDCGLWIRDIFTAPNQDWVFWQFTDRARLTGYSGAEPYIDLNVFNGTEADFDAYPKKDKNA